MLFRSVRKFDLSTGSYDGWAYMTGGTNSTLMAWYGPILLGCDMLLCNASTTASATLPKRHLVGLNLHGCISGDLAFTDFFAFLIVPCLKPASFRRSSHSAAGCGLLSESIS